MPNWKKVIVSGSDAVLNNITASGALSASGLLYASLSYDGTPVTDGVVAYDTSTGRLYYTGSYSAGNNEQTVPGGFSTYVQFSGSGGFRGDSGLTYGAQTNTLRVGTLTPQTIAAGYTLQSGSHFAVDGQALITNAEVVKWSPQAQQSENYILVGFGVGGATDPATGNPYFTGNPGDGLAQGDGQNASPLLGGLDEQGELENLSGARVNGALKIGGVYANYRTDSGWLVYANGFVQVPGSPGIAIRNGGIELFSSESYAGDLEGSGSIASPRASASAVFTLAKDSSSLLLQVGKEDLRDVMFISRSGDNPRIGVGTDNPLTTFDFKDVTDSRNGTKLILRTSRSTKGGEIGDEAGKINFTIDSSSYGDIQTSGSIAKILGSVTRISDQGASGKLSFEVADDNDIKQDTTEVFYLQKNPGGTLDLTYTVGVFEGSVNLNGSNSSLYAGKDVEAGGNITTTTGYVKADSLRIGTTQNPGGDSAIIAGDLILNNDFTSSGDISSSGDIIANNGLFSGNLTVEGDITAQNYIVSSSVTYMTQSFSSGSTIFGDTPDDTHQFTGSMDVTGSINGMIIKTVGDDGGVIKLSSDTNNTSVSIGHYDTTATRNISIGEVESQQTNAVQIGGRRVGGGQGSISIGDSAQHNHTTANSIGIGTSANRFSNGDIGIGNSALYNDGSTFNSAGTIAIGHLAGYSQDGTKNVILGSSAGRSSIGENSVYLGHSAGYYASGSGVVLLGYQAGYNLTGSNQLIIANTGSKHLIRGDFEAETVEITGSLDITRDLRVSTHITASGNISASGTITANGATFTGDLIVTGSQLITDDITSDGTIRARVKSFDIPHPTRKNKRLVYGALEGPEHGIYCRGESKELKVLLPPEWRAMVNTKEITVQITPIGEWQPLYFKKLHSNWLYFGCGDDREKVHFYWEIKGERTDVPKLETVQ